MKKYLRIVVPVLLAFFVVGSAVWYLFVYDRDFTRDLLLREARISDSHGYTTISAWLYSMAYNHSGNDEAVAIELANQYKATGNFTKAEVTLSNAIKASPSAGLYTALCRTYVEQDKLMDAVALLAGIPNEQIRQQLDASRPAAPAAAQKPGFYNTRISVTLQSPTGNIYYTTNGEYPSIQSAPYQQPVQLDEGETILYCISVDSQGLVSPVSVLSYTVGGIVEPAVFMDAEIEAAIRNALGLPGTTQLYTNDLWGITSFTVPTQIWTLEDLKLMPNLEELTINNLQLSSLSDLSSLKELRSLNLSGCRFPASELAILASMPKLEKLILADCALSTLADLENVTTLTYLDISNNTIRNLEPIANMVNMQELYMQHNALTSLDSLTLMYNLEKLNISFNSVTSLVPLGVCMRLSWLDASNNQISSVNGITALPLLTSLSLNYNRLAEVSALGACVQMRELSLNNNQISDLSALASMMSLEVLDFSYNHVYNLPSWQPGSALRVIQGAHNQVNNLQVLGGMANLTYVSMDYNQLTDISALANCPNLVQVNVFGNRISDVSALTDQSIIVNYDPT